MSRPVSDVADVETRLAPAGRCVDPLFQHSRHHLVGFVRDLQHAGLFFVAKKDALASNRHFLRPPSGPLLTGEGLRHVEFRGAPWDGQNGSVGSVDIKKAFHQMRIPTWLGRFLHDPLFSHRKLATQEKRSTKHASFPDSLIYPCPTRLPMGFSCAMFFLSRCRGPQHARGKC